MKAELTDELLASLQKRLIERVRTPVYIVDDTVVPALRAIVTRNEIAFFSVQWAKGSKAVVRRGTYSTTKTLKLEQRLDGMVTIEKARSIVAKIISFPPRTRRNERLSPADAEQIANRLNELEIKLAETMRATADMPGVRCRLPRALNAMKRALEKARLHLNDLPRTEA